MTTPRWPRPASAMNGYAAPRFRVVTWCAGSFGMRSLTPVNGRRARPPLLASVTLTNGRSPIRCPDEKVERT